ncbi:MAG: peptide deformylase [Clostridia bacterium]|nr:peptide deformylase [Clostridia bacterium]
MALREIRKDGDEILRKRAREVEKVDEKIATLIDDMIETMYKYDGVGLAAPQVGMLKRILVYDSDYVEDENNKNPRVLINPVIVKVSKKMATAEEGCLSYPDLYGYVDRPAKITVKAFDRNMKPVTIDAKDLEAVVIQHEIDHLDGIVFIDKAYNLHRGTQNEEEEKSQSKSKKKVK